MQNTEALRALFGRMQPMLPELFNMAYAICGNREQAEYALHYTLVEAWTEESHGGVGFREGLRNTLRSVACEEALKASEAAPEFTWNGLTGESEDGILAVLAAENVEIRRILALRCGCGLSVSRTARIMNLSVGQAQDLLDRFERTVRRRLFPGDRRSCEGLIARSVRQAFRQTDPAMPSTGAIYRTFAAEASETQRPSHLVARILRRVFYALAAVVCALLFWLMAVLMQPVRTIEMLPAETGTAMPTALPEAVVTLLPTAVPVASEAPQATEIPGMSGAVLETVTLQES